MSRIINDLATDAKPRLVIRDDSTRALLRKFFGYDLPDLELANLVGAIDDAVILAEGRGDRIFVQIRHPKLKIHDVFIAANDQNRIFVRIDEIEFQPTQRGQREDVRLLLRQIKQARKLNVAYLEAETDGNPQTFRRRNGFYVWVRYGFNAPLSAQTKALLPESLKFIKEAGNWRATETLNDLILCGGPAWWHENGVACFTLFDLREGSSSQQVFEEYVLKLRREGKL